MSRYGLVWMYCLLFLLYWAASCYWALITLKDAAEMRAVYNDRLGISEEELVSEKRCKRCVCHTYLCVCILIYILIQQTGAASFVSLSVCVLRTINPERIHGVTPSTSQPLPTHTNPHPPT